MNNPAPIAFFCFNRADKTRAFLEALSQNDLAAESELFIFCDGPRNIRDLPKVKEVHAVIDKISGFKKVHVTKREINYGVKNSIVGGISEVLKNYEKIIIVEDDILCAKSFLRFINEGLDFYRDEKNVWCITGFNYPKKMLNFPQNYAEDIFFLKARNSAWGWGTWRDRFQKIDFEISDYEQFIKSKEQVAEFNKAGGNLSTMLTQQKQGKIDTWDVQISYAMFKNAAYTLYPIKTLTKNIGFDASGVHTGFNADFTDFEFENFTDFKFKKLAEIPNNSLAEEAYKNFHRDPFFLVRWFQSKKKRKNLKWLAVGFLISELLHLVLKFF
jgi:hypothetical protein